MSGKKKVSEKKILKEVLKRGSVSEKLLVELGIDTNQLPLDYKNLIIDRHWLWGVRAKVKNKDADLSGNPIKSNEKLIKRAIKNWHSNEKDILFTEMLDLGIYTPETRLKIGENILLISDEDDRFSIRRFDKKKDLEGKWENHVVDLKKVMNSLRSYEYNATRQKMKEVTLNNDLVIFLKNYFTKVEKPTKGIQIDVIIGEGENRVLIELKLARELRQKAKSRQARSQIEDYRKEFKAEDIILLIAGNKEDKKHPYVIELIEKAKELSIKDLFLIAQ